MEVADINTSSVAYKMQKFGREAVGQKGDTKEVMSFGPFRLDCAQRVLLEGDKRVHIGGRAMDMLILLLERPGELVTKDEIMARVWHDTCVEPANVTVNICALRRALGDSHAGNRHIINIPGRGYLFVTPVAVVRSPMHAAMQPLRPPPSTCRFVDATTDAAACDHCLLGNDLRDAISREELRLVYQPLKDIRTHKVVGFEALLRWTHSTRGEVLPAEFIPIAEDTGAILQIGEWGLRTACREAATWIKPLTVAVNVSAVQIHHANFAHVLHQILFETGLAPARLELEITETALIHDLDYALATLRRIKTLGVRIAMDDFGTGYSSLSNLLAFPFDKIKIDGSFIKSVNVNDKAAAVVRSVLGLARALKLPVLAEGVERTDQLEFLENELCNEAQGYLLGRPDNIEGFRELTHGGAKAPPIDVPHKSKASPRGR
jgi:EAL domain-containing protein (putative c-di-GMP-specific phosphodiesterase class I)/DNA-binding winged helix-turn-helix (wHTH) protein